MTREDMLSYPVSSPLALYLRLQILAEGERVVHVTVPQTEEQWIDAAMCWLGIGGE